MNNAGAASRRWALWNDSIVLGDFQIGQSTTQTGSSYDVKMYFDAAGHVGIGTTAPAGKLTVAGYSATAGVGNINITNLTYPTSGWAFRIGDNATVMNLSLDRENAG